MHELQRLARASIAEWWARHAERRAAVDAVFKPEPYQRQVFMDLATKGGDRTVIVSTPRKHGTAYAEAFRQGLERGFAVVEHADRGADLVAAFAPVDAPEYQGRALPAEIGAWHGVRIHETPADAFARWRLVELQESRRPPFVARPVQQRAAARFTRTPIALAIAAAYP